MVRRYISLKKGAQIKSYLISHANITAGFKIWKEIHLYTDQRLTLNILYCKCLNLYLVFVKIYLIRIKCLGGICCGCIQTASRRCVFKIYSLSRLKIFAPQSYFAHSRRILLTFHGGYPAKLFLASFCPQLASLISWISEYFYRMLILFICWRFVRRRMRSAKVVGWSSCSCFFVFTFSCAIARSLLRWPFSKADLRSKSSLQNKFACEACTVALQRCAMRSIAAKSFAFAQQKLHFLQKCCNLLANCSYLPRKLAERSSART